MEEKKKFRKRRPNLIPRVLIGAPTSDRHRHLLKKWTKHVGNLNYPNFDLCLVDTSDNEEYTKKIKEIKIKGKEIITWRHKWDKKKAPFAIHMLAHVREEIRQYFLNNNYDYMLWLDDDVFLPENGIQRLLSYNKDCVGFYVHVYPKGLRKPCVFKSGEIVMGKGLEYYTFDEIKQYKRFVDRYKVDKLTDSEKRLIPFLIKDLSKPYLFKPYALNMGLLMVSRKVMENVPFRTHLNFIYGEDLWWFAEATDKKYEFWCDSSLRCKHENTSWNQIIEQEPEKMPGFWIAMGPSNANRVEFIKR